VSTSTRTAVATLSAGIAAALPGCGAGGSPTSRPPSSPPVVVAAPTARYEVLFETAWSAASHPSDFPANPHLSPLIGATHSSAVGFWRPGRLATEGIEAMAELGSVTPLDLEVQGAIAAGTAQHLLRGEGIARSPGATRVEFEVGRDHPLVTLVSMIAPSPDWFVGVHDLSLMEGGDWVAERVATLWPYDAGTDRGRSYSSPDLDSQPREPVRQIDGFPFDVGGPVAPVGTFTFRRLP
jgi:hypothetical protein